MRTWTTFAESDPEARAVLTRLPELRGQPKEYRSAMQELGKHLGACIHRELPSGTRDVRVVCTVEDADFLANGVIQKLEEKGLNIYLLCLWNKSIKEHGISISPVLKTYQEEKGQHSPVLVVVKSIISGACVVKTNITRAVSTSNPERVFVVSPVMLEGAEDKLSAVFPKRISNKFEYIHFATDTGKEGDNVVPGIGGSVYELLGLGNSSTKNKYTPQIVKDRRRKLFPITVSTPGSSGPLMSDHLGVGISGTAGSRTSPAHNIKVKSQVQRRKGGLSSRTRPAYNTKVKR